MLWEPTNQRLIRQRRNRRFQTEDDTPKFKKCLFAFFIFWMLLLSFYYYMIFKGIRNVHSIPDSCPTRRILTSNLSGPRCTVIFEFLSVLALSKLYPKMFVGYISRPMKKQLETIFQPVSFLDLESLPRRCTNHVTKLWVPNDHNTTVMLHTALIANAKYVTMDMNTIRYEEIINYGLENMRKELRFKPVYILEAHRKLKQIRKQFPKRKNPIVVGIHYRGNEYKGYLYEKHRISQRVLAAYTYYRKAMDYFVDKYKEVVFVMVSVDHEWLAAKKKFFNRYSVVFNPYERDPEAKQKDLALLSHCNHTIINYGTFGIFAALYNGGETIAFDLNIPLDEKASTAAMGIAKRLKNWQLMNNMMGRN